MFNPDDIKSCIEEWMGDVCDIKEACDTYIVIIRKTEKQKNSMNLC